MSGLSVLLLRRVQVFAVDDGVAGVVEEHRVGARSAVDVVSPAPRRRGDEYKDPRGYQGCADDGTHPLTHLARDSVAPRVRASFRRYRKALSCSAARAARTTYGKGREPRRTPARYARSILLRPYPGEVCRRETQQPDE